MLLNRAVPLLEKLHQGVLLIDWADEGKEIVVVPGLVQNIVHHPVRVVGTKTVGIAMLLRMPLFMLLISFTLVASSLSVIIQRAYFKATHGKRIFQMSPIHQHFELCGLSEKKIVAMYAAVVAVLSLLAILTIRL